jgi:hypothetical protein
MHGPINVKSPNNTSKWQMGFNSAFKGLILFFFSKRRNVVTTQLSMRLMLPIKCYHIAVLILPSYINLRSVCVRKRKWKLLKKSTLLLLSSCLLLSLHFHPHSFCLALKNVGSCGYIYVSSRLLPFYTSFYLYAPLLLLFPFLELNDFISLDYRFYSYFLNINLRPPW